jgi:hypothetical protein
VAPWLSMTNLIPSPKNPENMVSACATSCALPRPLSSAKSAPSETVMLISHPTRIGVGLQLEAVQEDLTVREIFVQHDDETWSLDDLGRALAGAVVRTPRQALM